MKITCSKSNLVKGVSIVSKAVPSKTTMPILECILIDATTDIIKLTANDMELGIQTEISGDIIDRGMIAIDAKIFSEIVRKLPDNEVSIETDDIDKLVSNLEKANISLLCPLEERWYKKDDMEHGEKHFIVMDPDGYILRFMQDLGQKTI